MSQPTTLPPRYQTDHDVRLQIYTLRHAGLTYSAIRDRLGVSIHQIQYALSTQLTPKKRVGRPPTLNSEQVQELISFVCQSRITRQMSWQALADHFYPRWGVTKNVIRRALRAAGYTRKKVSIRTCRAGCSGC